jgi:hypothetical protein
MMTNLECLRYVILWKEALPLLGKAAMHLEYALWGLRNKKPAVPHILVAHEYIKDALLLWEQDE